MAASFQRNNFVCRIFSPVLNGHIVLSSPKGQSFATCQEVSAYLMSLLGYPEFKTDNIEYGSTQQHGLCADDGVNVS
jgi:hypothetical protein